MSRTPTPILSDSAIAPFNGAGADSPSPSDMNNHPTIGLVDVYAAAIPTLTFRAGVHINYAETVLPMRDGLPKLKDFPKEFGGSGEVVPE